MAYQVTFQGKVLEEIQKVAFSYATTVWAEFKVVNVFADISETGVSLTISFVQREPKE